jgi:hypothetical protein
MGGGASGAAGGKAGAKKVIVRVVWEAYAMRFLFALLLISSAAAEELPKNLLLKCDGRLTILGLEALPHQSKFETMLRLKDGELSDTGGRALTTKGCQLRNGVVGCALKEVVPTAIDNGSARRALSAYIVRETGEYNHFWEQWNFEGRNASGKQTAHMNWHREGICHPVSSPVF